MERFLPGKPAPAFLVVYRSCIDLALGLVLGHISPILLTYQPVERTLPKRFKINFERAQPVAARPRLLVRHGARQGADRNIG